MRTEGLALTWPESWTLTEREADIREEARLPRYRSLDLGGIISLLIRKLKETALSPFLCTWTWTWTRD
jgi:hypothetical protein